MRTILKWIFLKFAPEGIEEGEVAVVLCRHSWWAHLSGNTIFTLRWGVVVWRQSGLAWGIEIHTPWRVKFLYL